MHIAVKNRLNSGTRWFLALFVMSGLMLGCAVETTTTPKPKAPFFDKWRETAKKSRGYSPVAKKYTLDMPAEEKAAVASQPPVSAPEEKALPVDEVTLKMHNVDVATLLRALARSANQNIVISVMVKGKTSIFLKGAPWDQTFKTILSTNGLTYAWEGDIIRILTVQDMELDLTRETHRKGLRLAGPMTTRVIPIQYADAKNLKLNFEKLLTKDKSEKPLGAVMVDDHSNSLVIQAIPGDIERMLTLIHKLDNPTPQILIEAQIVEATSETARELGVQWGGLMHVM